MSNIQREREKEREKKPLLSLLCASARAAH